MAKQFLLGIKKVIRLMPIIIGQLLQEIAKAVICIHYKKRTKAFTLVL